MGKGTVHKPDFATDILAGQSRSTAPPSKPQFLPCGNEEQPLHNIIRHGVPSSLLISNDLVIINERMTHSL